MFLFQAIDGLQAGLRLDLVLFLPELILCGTIVLLLVLRLLPRFDREHLGVMSLILTVFALVVGVIQWRNHIPDLFPTPEGLSASRAQNMFSGLLVYDRLTMFVRLFLLAFAALVIWLSMLTGIPDREDSADFYCLLLGATLGMSLMASANHLLMVYIGVEMASLPSYALAGFLKGRRQGSEAALKYVVYGGGAAGIMLYGISLIAGVFGTAYLPDVAKGLAAVISHEASADPVLLLALLFILVGFAFKLAAVPFHFWCPDVFEGAAAEVAAFLSVASKGAALALLGRFAFTIAGLSAAPVDYAGWLDVSRILIPSLAIFAIVTATFGNLAAYPQTNLKRLLAYSTIAQAGYMMMGVTTLTREGASAVLFYLIAYLFMNLGAFAVVAFLRNQTGSEDLSAYRGMVYRSPVLTVTLAVFLLSLLGMPPLAGFAAKLQIFSALVHAGNDYSAAGLTKFGGWMYALLAIGCINTVISAVYYLKVLKVMVLERSPEQAEGLEPRPLAVPFGSALYATVLALLVFVVGLAWNPLARFSDRGTNRFAPAPLQATVTKVQS